MNKVKEPIYLAWGGGKDSMMMLFLLKDSREYDVVGLVSCVTEDDQRALLHGVGRDLLEAQAKALAFALVPRNCCYKEHTVRLGRQVTGQSHQEVHKIAFGDLYLDDIRDAREERLEALGMEAIFPLWHRDTAELAQMFLDNRFKAMVTSVELATLGMDYVGRTYDRDFLYDLPIAVDPCGENGEFHTFVYDGPLFKNPVGLKLGDKFTSERFHYCAVSAKRKVPSKRKKVANSR